MISYSIEDSSHEPTQKGDTCAGSSHAMKKRAKDARRSTFLIRDIDPELWAHVKAAAALNHETVSAAIKQFLEEYAKKGGRHAAR